MCRRIAFHLLKALSIVAKVSLGRVVYMFLLRKAHEVHGVRFDGPPRYIHPNVMLDGSGTLRIGAGVVISTNVVILTHDYCLTTALTALGRRPRTDLAILAPVSIGNNCFFGAGAIVLPGTVVGDNVIAGAGAILKGSIPSNAVVAGNPAKRICGIEEWLVRKEALGATLRVLTDAY